MNGERQPTVEMVEILQKLNSKSLYSLSDFKLPHEAFSFKKTKPSENIAKLATGLAEDRFSNLDHFISRTTNLFSDFQKMDDPNSINKNQLIATLFVLKYPFNKQRPRYHQEVKYRSKEVIKALLGSNDEYITGKKTSDYIQPIYLILRSLKESRSGWLLKVFEELELSQKLKIFTETQTLVDSLLKSINQPKERKKLKELFDKTLNLQILLEKPVEEPKVEVKKDKPKIFGIDIKIKHALHDREMVKNQGEDTPEVDINRRFMMETILSESGIIIDDVGNIKLNEKNLSKILSIFGNREKFPKNSNIGQSYDDLTSVLGNKSHRDIALSALLTTMSDNNKFAHWLFRGIKGKDFNRIKLLKIFERSIGEIFTEKTSRDLMSGLNRTMKDNKTDFGYLNEKIVEVVYRLYYPNEEISPMRLLQFTKTPGINDMIFSLRKFFLLKTIKGNLPGIPEAINRHEFYLRPSAYIWDTENENQYDYEDLSKNNLQPSAFINYSSNKLLCHLGLFSLEKYLKARKGRFDEVRKLISHKREAIKLFDSKTTDDVIPSDDGQLSFPIKILRSKEKIEIYFNDEELGHIPIVIEK